MVGRAVAEEQHEACPTKQAPKTRTDDGLVQRGQEEDQHQRGHDQVVIVIRHFFQILVTGHPRLLAMLGRSQRCTLRRWRHGWGDTGKGRR